MDSQSTQPGSTPVHSLDGMIEPVRHKLNQFNPGVEYESQQILHALRSAVKSGRIHGIKLMPDLKSLSPPVDGNNFQLLLNLACKTFVDLIVFPNFPTRRRVSKHHREFCFCIGE